MLNPAFTAFPYFLFFSFSGDPSRALEQKHSAGSDNRLYRNRGLYMLDTFFENDSYKAQSSSYPRMKGNSSGTIENIAPGGISKSGIYHYDSSSA